MLLYEYQVKSLLHRFQVPSPLSYAMSSREEIREVIEKSGLQKGVLKAQVHAGGRGKSGGVKIGTTARELEILAGEMLGMKIVNAQTGPQGLRVERLMLTPFVEIHREIYLGVALDTKSGRHVVIATKHGGMDVEAVARTTPREILREELCEKKSLYSFQVRRLVHHLSIEKELQEPFAKILEGLVRAYVYFDATLLEVNPLVITEQKTLLALDAKMSVDDNALFRQPEVHYFFDKASLPEGEAKAHELELAYISMDGSIGCIVNGAGLAMATMDIIKFWGGTPANFLDVGGGASEEKVVQGFELVLSDPRVRVVFVNIFGGIMNCELIARALLKCLRSSPSFAARRQKIVVRMEGTNVTGARRVLTKAGFPLEIVDSLNEAARRAVMLAKIIE